MNWRFSDREEAPRPRTRRPRWLIFFTVAMLLLGGRMFLGGVMDLHRLVTGKAEALHLEGRLDAQQEALLRAQVVLANELSATRPGLLSLHAAARLALGLIYLFAVAAVFSSDARGRRASVLAGWAGMGASLGNALFLMLLVRRMLPWLVPKLEAAFAQDAARAGRPAPAADMVAEQASMFLYDVPLMVTVIGVVFSLLLIAYFRSQRVRLFYNQPRQVDHG